MPAEQDDVQINKISTNTSGHHNWGFIVLVIVHTLASEMACTSTNCAYTVFTMFGCAISETITMIKILDYQFS